MLPPDVQQVQMQGDNTFRLGRKTYTNLKSYSADELLKGFPEDAELFVVADEVDDKVDGIKVEYDADKVVEDLYNNDNSDEAVFVKTSRGSTILQYKGNRYRKAYSSKLGDKWVCSINKNCTAFLCLNDKDELVMANETHTHPESDKVELVDQNQKDVAVVIRSRKGKDILLFRQFTYRRNYEKLGRIRWVCSNIKNCRAVIFTNMHNEVTSAFEEHCHDPPKYYLKTDHLLGALKQPLL